MIIPEIAQWDQILIKDLLLRTIIGFNPEERIKRQDVLINITLYADFSPAQRTDNVEDAVNYRTITKRVITMVENSSFNLVERLASETAILCLADSRVAAARVRIEKPGALRFARSVGVEILRTRESLTLESNQVFLSIGSNIEPEKNIRRCVELLALAVQIENVSPVYLTTPVGDTVQPQFLNAAVVIRTPLSALELKRDVLLAIENKLNRIRVADKFAPRTIDLDIVLFNYAIIDIEGRHIPDPDLLKHAHITVPLADVAPYYVHPETGQSLKEISAALPKNGIILRDDIHLDNMLMDSTNPAA